MNNNRNSAVLSERDSAFSEVQRNLISNEFLDASEKSKKFLEFFKESKYLEYNWAYVFTTRENEDSRILAYVPSNEFKKIIRFNSQDFKKVFPKNKLPKSYYLFSFDENGITESSAGANKCYLFFPMLHNGKIDPIYYDIIDPPVGGYIFYNSKGFRNDPELFPYQDYIEIIKLSNILYKEIFLEYITPSSALFLKESILNLDKADAPLKVIQDFLLKALHVGRTHWSWDIIASSLLEIFDRMDPNSPYNKKYVNELRNLFNKLLSNLSSVKPLTIRLINFCKTGKNSDLTVIDVLEKIFNKYDNDDLKFLHHTRNFLKGFRVEYLNLLQVGAVSPQQVLNKSKKKECLVIETEKLVNQLIEINRILFDSNQGKNEKGGKDPIQGEFGIVSDINLLSFFSNGLNPDEDNQDDTEDKYNINHLMKRIILNRCQEIGIDEGVNLEKEMDELKKNEPMMYYGIKRYRDHLMHSARIALIGDWLMGKVLKYPHNKDKCKDCLDKKCDETTLNISLEEAIEKLLPSFIVASITDREKTKVPFSSTDEIYNYDRAFSYHLNKPKDKNLIRKMWLITAIDHDIGYSFTYIRELFNTNSMLKSDEPHTISVIRKEIEQVFDQLYDIIRSHATCIESILHDTCLKKIPHGVIGAFHVRNLIENEYILELAGRAIARHDDDSRQICFQKEPLCFLLVLLDEIQEWGRPLKVGEELGFDEIQSFSMKLFARCDLPYMKYYREYDGGAAQDKIGTFVFELDYTESQDYLEQTKFSFPHFFYLKQLNLSRLLNGPGIKVKIRMPGLAIKQFKEFKGQMEKKYKIAEDWAENYLKVEIGKFVEFDISKCSEPVNYFDMRPPKIWPLIKDFDFFEQSKKGNKNKG